MDAAPGSVIRAVREEAGAIVIQLAGDVDLNVKEALRAELLSLTESRPARIVVNLSGVNYMDSSGVATLVELHQRCRRNRGELVLCHITPRVRAIFEISKLERIFTIRPSERDALSDA